MVESHLLCLSYIRDTPQGHYVQIGRHPQNRRDVVNKVSRSRPRDDIPENQKNVTERNAARGPSHARRQLHKNYW